MRPAARWLAPWLLVACASAAPGPVPERSFDFARDTFAYSNDLYWTYENGVRVGRAAEPDADGLVEHGHRCVVMARSARQFFHAARFAPELPRLSADGYRERVREVLRSDPRRTEPLDRPVVIPGYASLREFSADHEHLLKEEIGGHWAAWMQRGNWRLIFPFGPRQQRASAEGFVASLERHHPPIAHLLNFPDVDINHAVLVFDVEETPREVRFRVYDPNDARAPADLVFERASATFRLAPTRAFPGGPVKLYEIYDGFWF